MRDTTFAHKLMLPLLEREEVLMRIVLIGLLLLTACDRSTDNEKGIVGARPAAVSFDGGDYRGEAAKIAHGKRMATLFGCSGCHGADYAGVNFGEMIPVVKGLWATNISLTIPRMSDAELETLLRKGVHPTRDEIYLMPSKQTQFLSKRDMDALIAHLRTVPQTGKPTPPPPRDFEKTVAARLPDDYWRWKPGQPRTYHSSAEEVAYFKSNQAPALGTSSELRRGHHIALTVCSACHGAALDGKGEDAGGIEAALQYDDAQFQRLLTDSVSRDGRQLKMEWGFGHEVIPLTQAEKSAAMTYARAWARRRAR